MRKLAGTKAAARPPAPRRIASLPRLAMPLALGLTLARPAGAFPLLDPTNQDSVPAGTELAPPDALDLRHQLQLANGLMATPAGGGWTFLPRIDLQEMLTDNVYQQHTPRRVDLTSVIAPGISILGDLPRVQLRLDYAPVLMWYGRTPQLNALTQQLNATGLVTVVPDLLFVDLRALAGVQSRSGGIGGLGSLGASGAAGLTPGGVNGNAAGLGLTKNNLTQTTSAGISPYLLHRFGDWGTAKLGTSLDISRFSNLSGFTSLPFPTDSGNGGQSLVTFEQTGRFTTGEYFNQLQDTVDFDLLQSNTTYSRDATTRAFLPGTSNDTGSNRQTMSNQLTYAVSHAISVFGSFGYENIRYSGANSTNINGLTWRFGGTLAPNPDSALTLSYGHNEGANSFSFDGHYALSARTLISASYTNTLGTQLENLQRQLNAARVGNNGNLVDAQTGNPAFSDLNATAVQPGLYRFSTFNVRVQTTLDRDLISMNLMYSTQSATGGTRGGSSTDSATAMAQWTHQLSADLLLSTSLSYTQQTSGGFGGKSNSIAGSAALQYTISETLAGTVRYSYYQRDSSTAALDMYQNLLIIGITKTF